MIRICTYNNIKNQLLEIVKQYSEATEQIELIIREKTFLFEESLANIFIIENKKSNQLVYENIITTTDAHVILVNHTDFGEPLETSNSRKGSDMVVDFSINSNLNYLLDLMVKNLNDKMRLETEKVLLRGTISSVNQIFSNQCQNFGLIENSLPIGLGILENGKLVFANIKLREIIGYSRFEEISIDRIQIEHGHTIRRICKMVTSRNQPVSEIQVLLPSGVVKELQITTDAATNFSSTHVFTVLETNWLHETRLTKDITLAIHEVGNNNISVNNLIEKISQILEGFFVGLSFKIIRYNPRNESIIIPFHQNNSNIFEETRLSKSVVSQVIWEKKAIFVDNSDQNHNKSEFMLTQPETNPFQWFGVPLFVNDEIIGLITIQSSRSETLIDSNTRNTIELVTHQISLMINRVLNSQTVADAFRKVEESGRLKSAFLSNMSHEVRTPLNSIIGFATLLQEEDLDTSEIPLFASHILSSGNSLLKIIDDIVDVAKIEAGELKINKVDTNITILLADVYKKLCSLLDNDSKKDIKPELHIEECLNGSVIKTDPFRLKQSLLNLCENAVKFTAKGSIKLLASKHGEYIRITVKDTGIGMAATKLANIFDQFKQVEEGDSRLYGGTGIGLSISRSIIKMLGGSVMVESKPDEGSSFITELPFEEVKFSTTRDTNKLNYDWKDKNIIVADDIISNFEFIDALLKPSGANLLWASDGSKAVEFVKKVAGIDLILMDLQMPIMDGYQATSIVKSIKPEIPIIVLTAFSQISDRNKAIDAGCDEYLQKPIMANKLFSLMSKFLD